MVDFAGIYCTGQYRPLDRQRSCKSTEIRTVYNCLKWLYQSADNKYITTQRSNCSEVEYSSFNHWWQSLRLQSALAIWEKQTYFFLLLSEKEIFFINLRSFRRPSRHLKLPFSPPPCQSFAHFIWSNFILLSLTNLNRLAKNFLTGWPKFFSPGEKLEAGGIKKNPPFYPFSHDSVSPCAWTFTSFLFPQEIQIGGKFWIRFKELFEPDLIFDWNGRK